MTSPPDLAAVTAIDRAVAPIDAASTPEEVREGLAVVLRDLAAARAAVVVTVQNGTAQVAAIAGETAVEPGLAMPCSTPLLDALNGRSAAVQTVPVDPLGDAVDLWPILALTRAVGVVAVVDATDRSNDMIAAAVCRYAGLRVLQLFDAELREDQLHERGAAIKTLRRLADTDALTGVSNRAGVFAVLNSLLGRGEQVGLLYVDLDGFKQINDVHGHAAGDRVLAAVAKRLRRVVRAPDLVGRIGGDEFVLVVRGGDDQALFRLIGRVNDVLAEPVTLKDAAISVQASCGVAIAAHGGSAADLLAAADARMYEDKHGRTLPELRVIDLDSRR
ncbi:MAG: hypothetical protein QOG34_2349 [Frankiaceae bacterium]|nr:hypothetical protein [Frankiaceae bacterium]